MLVTIESLRTDHVGHLDGTRETTPNLDALAAEAMVFENAHSVTSWTLASHASLFTGLYPSAHRAMRPKSRLPDAAVTLAERLRAAGWVTGGFVTNTLLNGHAGWARGFVDWMELPYANMRQLGGDPRNDGGGQQVQRARHGQHG